MQQLPDNITVLVQSPQLRCDEIEVVVTIPTFRRPEHLLETLHSVKAQVTERRFAIIVMENEAEEREGARAARARFEDGTFEGLLLLARDRGNCNAYNAGWLAALEYFPRFSSLIVIDDDEIADPYWLENMAKAKDAYSADVVGGPQIPVFAHLSQEKWASHPIFAPPYNRSGPVPALYSSGNLLVSRQVLETMPYPFLDPMFNFMGGGDSDFISRSVDHGFRTAWCAEALILETIPSRRLEREWIRARGLRNGVISTLVEKRKRAGKPFGGLSIILKSLVLLAFSPFKAVAKTLKSGSPAAGLYYIHVGLGRVLAEFGYANEQYRQPEKN
ncbi:glycosyltransferase family 2 protein [Phyllobacterium leguminum]|uniref:GT2 family glycosyltransferase n=1 Tax=Phyllobacterium leguminum TaxID=314237 RepID=A0A318SY73_9HYPH|nr:glycosyltransferase [Phyllobacterium leguminum]PYE86393.1 GT2 family glycosyltransferase [Phyllobacterium leguminum]